MAVDTWPPDGGFPLDTEELFSRIRGTSAIEGITFLGGEPFEQAEALAQLACKVQAAGLSVTTFTGFSYEGLKTGADPATTRLLAATDLLIDGSYQEGLFDLSRPWVGSANQRYHFLTKRYRPSDIEGIPNQIEIRISPDGTAFLNGMGNFAKIKALLAGRNGGIYL
jgi:anaerobic ribonucleoside-triphosphate reductase activating protein